MKFKLSIYTFWPIRLDWFEPKTLVETKNQSCHHLEYSWFSYSLTCIIFFNWTVVEKALSDKKSFYLSCLIRTKIVLLLERLASMNEIEWTRQYSLFPRVSFKFEIIYQVLLLSPLSFSWSKRNPDIPKLSFTDLYPPPNPPNRKQN